MNSNQIEIESSNNEIRRQNLDQQKICEPKIVENTVNANGFTNRFTFFQALPLLSAFLMCAEFAMIVAQLQTKQVKIGLSISYAIVMIIVLVFWLLTTKIDPTDSTQILHKQAIKNKTPFNEQCFKYFCHICQTCVSKNSFHCRKCNRCVDVFDHHCKWLNNCIGAKNYFQFFGLVISSEIFILFHFIINCLNLSSTAQQYPNFPWIFYLEIIFIALDCTLLCVNSILLIMHMYLIIRKKTTIQLILERRKINKIHPSCDETPEDKQKIEDYECSVNETINVKKQGIKKIQMDLQMKSENNFAFKKKYSLKSRTNRIKVYSNKQINQ